MHPVHYELNQITLFNGRGFMKFGELNHGRYLLVIVVYGSGGGIIHKPVPILMLAKYEFKHKLKLELLNH